MMPPPPERPAISQNTTSPTRSTNISWWVTPLNQGKHFSTAALNASSASPTGPGPMSRSRHGAAS